MKIQKGVDEILAEYRSHLTEILGEDLDSVILYGSQARGNALDTSDIDVLCIMKKPFDYGRLLDITSEVTADISLRYDVVLSRVFVTRQDYASRNTPFLMNVRREAVPI